MSILKKLTALLLVLAMVFAFAACAGSSNKGDTEDKDDETVSTDKGNDEDKNEDTNDNDDDEDSKFDEDEENNKFVGEWKGTADYSDFMSEQMSQIFGFECGLVFLVDVELELKSNGKFDLAIVKNSVKYACEDMVKDIYDTYSELCEDNGEKAMSYDEFIAASEIDIDGLVDSMADSLKISGEYRIDGNRIYTDENEYFQYIDGELYLDVPDMCSIWLEKE